VKKSGVICNVLLQILERTMKLKLLILLIMIPMDIVYAGTRLAEIPLSKMFWALYKERNIIGQNDCSNKCGRYLRALVSKGYKAEIVIIKPYRS